MSIWRACGVVYRREGDEGRGRRREEKSLTQRALRSREKMRRKEEKEV